MWHLVVNFILLMWSSIFYIGNEDLVLISRMKVIYGYWHLMLGWHLVEWQNQECGQECQFHIATDCYYWDLVVKMAILHWSCNGQEWQFYIGTLLLLHLVVKNGQEWQFHIATDMQWSLKLYMASVVKNSYPYCHLKGKNLYMATDICG